MINMNDKALDSAIAIKTFIGSAAELPLSIEPELRYEWIAATLKRTKYLYLKKSEKSIIKNYIANVTTYSRAQITRLIKIYKKGHHLKRKKSTRNKFTKKYTLADIFLLVEIDKAHEQLSGGLTKKLLERAYKVYNIQAYKRLSEISISHIYNLRKNKIYIDKRRKFEKTKSSSVKIGKRKKPRPNGKPGYIRIDTVHQGDQDKQKGVYHINAVDEVTQFEIICSVEKISEVYLIPILEDILLLFPFKIKGFHSDNGSEYINHRVAKLLNKLHIELTKSRARQSSDNGLAETKNGCIIRKHLGYEHIPQKWAPFVNEFNKKYLTPYVNCHRPCYFPVEKTNKFSKIVKTYPYKSIMTPYEKFKSLPNCEQYLKEGITLLELDKISSSMTDLEAAKLMQTEKNKLFKLIFDS